MTRVWRFIKAIANYKETKHEVHSETIESKVESTPAKPKTESKDPPYITEFYKILDSHLDKPLNEEEHSALQRFQRIIEYNKADEKYKDLETRVKKRAKHDYNLLIDELNALPAAYPLTSKRQLRSIIQKINDCKHLAKLNGYEITMSTRTYDTQLEIVLDNSFFNKAKRYLGSINLIKAAKYAAIPAVLGGLGTLIYFFPTHAGSSVFGGICGGIALSIAMANDPKVAGNPGCASLIAGAIGGMIGAPVAYELIPDTMAPLQRLGPEMAFILKSFAGGMIGGLFGAIPIGLLSSSDSKD